MYLEQHMEYSEERGTWNLFVNGEWYLEGTYEQCEEAMFNNAACEDDDDYWDDSKVFVDENGDLVEMW